VRRPLALAAATLALAAVASALPVALVRWVDPPTSTVMLSERVARFGTGASVHHHWVPWEAIAPTVPIAVVAAEDQRFPLHRGFDVTEIWTAIAERQRRGRMRGASTISQQVAKNLFLWSGRSWIRKALEAYVTVLIELTWPKRRILEVYLNVAQFGADVFGVGAASDRYFHKAPFFLSAGEAALLAAVLPNPIAGDLAHPSPGLRERAAWIRGQVALLGGPAYLAGLSA
jgi:monofunctional biosynthetic peptidoglycan transglycosylase